MGVTSRFFRCIVLLVFLISVADAVSCGDTILVDTNLSSNLDCGGHGLIMGVDDITLDCNGYLISRNESLNDSGEPFFFGIQLHNISNVTIKNCVIRDFDYGIFLNLSNNCLLYNNTLSFSEGTILIFSSNLTNVTSNTLTNNNGGIGILLGESNTILNNTIINGSAEAIYLVGSHNNSIIGNFINDNSDDGIVIDESDGNILSYNTISNNDEGIYMRPSSDYNSIISNTIINGDYGVFSFLSTGNKLFNNSIIGNDVGVFFDTVTNSLIINNTVSNNDDEGIYLESSSHTQIEENTVNNNGLGIKLIPYSFNNTFSNNTVNYNLRHGLSIDNSSMENKLYGNRVCFNNLQRTIYNDIYINGNTLGENNTCDTTYKYNDTNTTGCVNPCVPCGEILTSDISLNADLNCSDKDSLEGLIVGTDSITLDCRGHKIQGKGLYFGIVGLNVSNVTVKKCNVSNFEYGMFFELSSNNTLSNNVVTNNDEGGIILISSSNFNTLTSNTARNNSAGIIILESTNNTLINNTADYNTWGSYIDNLSTGNALYDNYFCFNNISGGAYYDIYDGDATTGDNNTCNTVFNYNDSSNIMSGCVYRCHLCELLTGWNLISLSLII